ncbi:MAG: hypothetical protein CSB23_04710 [Deltaproteobacteria bacterium]|nr:MAG: hypothetical protein CSB23_04710 [Deltaproteobacteria bacterium]
MQMIDKQIELLIKGNLVLPDRVAYNSCVGVSGGVIIGIYDSCCIPDAQKIIDVSGCFVFPGVVDAHVHSYSFLNEGFENSTAAAAAGGVSTIIEMPYDKGAPVNNPEILEKKIDAVGRLAMVDVALLATLPKTGGIEGIEPMCRLGACGFKLSLFETDPDRFPRIEDDVLLEVLPLIKAQGLTAGFHAENDVIIEALVARSKAEKRTDPLAHCRTRPPVSESLAVGKLLELTLWTDSSLHIYHCSHPRCVEMIEWYRAQNVDVTVETCPHYLLMSENDMPQKAAFAKINPPMRKFEEATVMWQYVINGEIDMITSDHAPWPLENKQNLDIFANGSGAPGLETLLPLMYSEGVVARGLSPVELSRLMSANPAQRFMLAPRKGHIALGADADFAILDPSIQWTIKGSESYSSAKWSPYEGMSVTGKVVRTLVRGREVFRNGKILVEGAGGEYIPACL